MGMCMKWGREYYRVGMCGIYLWTTREGYLSTFVNMGLI